LAIGSPAVGPCSRRGWLARQGARARIRWSGVFSILIESEPKRL